jgi:hypothetical protein
MSEKGAEGFAKWYPVVVVFLGALVCNAAGERRFLR